MRDRKVRADIEGGKISEESERRSDRLWRSGVKENRVCRLEGNIRMKKCREPPTYNTTH